MPVDSVSQSSGAFSVNHSHAGQMSQIGVVQVFVQQGHSFVHSFAQQIDFRGNGKAFGHFQLAGSGALDRRRGDGFFFYQNKIIYVGLDPHNAALDKQCALGVRQSADDALKSHGKNLYGIAFLQLFGIHGLFGGRLFLLPFYRKPVILFADVIPQLLPFLFQLLYICTGACLIEIPDGLVGYILGLLKYFPGLLVGFPQNLILSLIDFFVFLLKLFLERTDPFLIFSDLLVVIRLCSRSEITSSKL